MTFPEAITEVMPSDNEMVTGVVTAINPLTVNVRGALITPGTLASYIPSVGDPVQLLRQDATWLVLGASVSGDDATNAAAGFTANTVTASTTSATYVNVTGASFTFTKRLDNSRVRTDAAVSLFLSVAANTKPRFGLDFIDTATLTGPRFDLMEMLVNPLATHTTIAGGRLYSGIPAGTYTVQLLWLRAAGAGQLNINTDDWVSIIAAEVA